MLRRDNANVVTQAVQSACQPNPCTSIHNSRLKLTIQEVRRHQQLQTQFRRDLHIRHISTLLEALVVEEVFTDLLEYHGAYRLERGAASNRFGEPACATQSVIMEREERE